MQNDSNRKLIKGMNIILVTNIVNLILNAITNFILPKYLMIEVYAQIKEYQMYVSYVGLLHLGYTEGVYLKYGGKSYERIDKAELKCQIVSLFILQVVMSLVLVVCCVIFKQYILMFAIISALPINMAGTYKLVYQATGEFKKYGTVMNITSILTLCINVILVLGLSVQMAYVYLGAYIVVYYIIWLVLERPNHFYRNIKDSISAKVIFENIRSGFLLMIGNFASIIQTTMDRLFVKAFLTSSDFAYYSFAVSMESMLNVLITPLTVTMYNYFCKDKEKKDYKNLLRILLIASSLLASTAYILNLLILWAVPKYTQAANIIYLLFATQFLYVFIKGVYLNLYKAHNMQKKYFVKLTIALIVGCVLNYIFYLVIKTKESFALATFVSAVLWYILCAIDFSEIGMKVREYMYMIYEVVIFFTIAYLANNSYIMAFIYFILLTLCGGRLILQLKFRDIKQWVSLVRK